MRKVINFIKENKLAVISILAIALCFGFLAIPGFIHYLPNSGVKGGYSYFLNGYQSIFNLGVFSEATKTPLASGNIGAGVAIIVLLAVGVVLFAISKFSSFFVLLGGLVNLTTSILFFTMEPSSRKVYTPYTDHSNCGWVTYFLGAVMLLVAVYAIYKAVIMMKNEIKHPTQSKGPSYSYLKK